MGMLGLDHSSSSAFIPCRPSDRCVSTCLCLCLCLRLSSCMSACLSVSLRVSVSGCSYGIEFHEYVTQLSIPYTLLPHSVLFIGHKRNSSASFRVLLLRTGQVSGSSVGGGGGGGGASSDSVQVQFQVLTQSPAHSQVRKRDSVLCLQVEQVRASFYYRSTTPPHSLHFATR